MKDKKTKRQILIRLTEQNYLKAIEACDVMKDENINRFVNLIIERYADDFIGTELKTFCLFNCFPLHYDLELDSKGATRSKYSVSPTLKAS